MRPISSPVRRELEARKNLCQRRLVFRDHECQGRITWEHALTFAGRQVDAAFAIVKICAWAHDVDEFQDGGNLDKEKNQYIALMQASEADMQTYSKAGWPARLAFLAKKFAPQLT